MSDIVERLRLDADEWLAGSSTAPLLREAADEIERLRAALARDRAEAQLSFQKP